MKKQFLKYVVEDEIGVLTINRPEYMNALNSELVSELITLLKEIQNSSLRCLVITGAGERAFVAGADIAEMKNMSSKDAIEFSKLGNIAMKLIEDFPAPVIAEINGFALGGGCELALSCDIRIGSENSVFSFPEVGLGILPGYGGIQRLSRIIGISRAKELVFTTRRVAAKEALEIGLINQMVPAKNLNHTVMDLAHKIADNAPKGIRATKWIANRSIGLSLEEVASSESELFGGCFETQDQREGMGSFLEKTWTLYR